MLFSLKCVQCMMTCVLRDQQYMLSVKRLLMVKKSVVDKEEPGRRVVSTTDATVAAVDSLMPSNRRVMR